MTDDEIVLEMRQDELLEQKQEADEEKRKREDLDYYLSNSNLHEDMTIRDMRIFIHNTLEDYGHDINEEDILDYVV
jgi:hypothetical protein